MLMPPGLVSLFVVLVFSSVSLYRIFLLAEVAAAKCTLTVFSVTISILSPFASSGLFSFGSSKVL